MKYTPLPVITLLSLHTSAIFAQTPTRPASPPKTSTRNAPPPVPLWRCEMASEPKVVDVCKLLTSGLSDSIKLRLLEGMLPITITAADAIGLNELAVPAKALELLVPAQPTQMGKGRQQVSRTTPASDELHSAPYSCQPSSGTRKRVIAVSTFDGSLVTGDKWYSPARSEGMRVTFSNRIVNHGNFVVVDREKIDHILQEQRRGISGQIKLGTQARRGEINGADAILSCSILKYRYQDLRKTIPWPVRVKLGTERAHVSVSYQLIDSETSEVIVTGEAQGEAKRTGRTEVRDIGMESEESDSGRRLLDDAVTSAIENLASRINSSEAKIVRRWVPAEGNITKISGGQVYLDIGSTSFVSACDKFEVHEVLGRVKSKETDEILGQETNRIGELIIREARDQMAIGAYTSGSIPLARDKSYIVRKMKPTIDTSSPTTVAASR